MHPVSEKTVVYLFATIIHQKATSKSIKLNCIFESLKMFKQQLFDYVANICETLRFLKQAGEAGGGAILGLDLDRWRAISPTDEVMLWEATGSYVVLQ